MTDQQETIVLTAALKGGDKMRKEFDKLSKGFLSVEDATRRATATMNGEFNKELKKTKQTIDKDVFNTGGMDKSDGFLGMGDFQKQAEMFGKDVKSSFETTKNAFKSEPMGIDPKELKELENNFKQVQEAVGGSEKIKKFFKEYDNAAGPLKMSQEQFELFNKNGMKFQSRGARMTNKLRMLTGGLKGFKMEMLGVMFFGMAMQKTFTGLMKPALELTGVFEIWKTTLQVLFLPLSIMILQFLMPLFKVLMNLSPETKKFIGQIVLFGAAIGTALFVVGTFALGIGALIMAFGGIFTIVDKLIPDISILGVNISSVAEAAIGIGIVTTAFKTLKAVADVVLTSLLNSKAIQNFFDRMGVEIDNSKTSLENFKTLISNVGAKIREKLGLETSDTEQEMGFSFKNMVDNVMNMKENINGFLDEIQFDELKDSVLKMADSFGSEDTLGSIESLAASLETIADAIDSIRIAYNKAKDILGTELPWARDRSDDVSPGSPGTFGAAVSSGADAVRSFFDFSDKNKGSVTQTNNFSGIYDKTQFQRLLDTSNSALISKLKRNGV